MEKITKKATKDKLWDAYEEALKQNKELKSKLVDPVAEAKVKANVEVTKATESIETSVLNDIMTTLQTSIENANAELEKYENIKKAKTLAESELQELFDIRANAETYVALVNSQIKMKDTFDKEYKEKKDAINLEFDILKKNIEGYKKDWEEERKKKDKLLAEERKKKEEEFEYEFNRKRKLEEDKLNDELKKKDTAFNESWKIKFKDLEERENNISSQEEDLNSLVNENEKLKKEATEAYNEGLEKGKEKAGASYAHEVRYIKKDNESKVALLQAEVNNLKASLEKAIEEKDSMANKLDKAYESIKEVSTSTSRSSMQSLINEAKSTLKSDKDAR